MTRQQERIAKAVDRVETAANKLADRYYCDGLADGRGHSTGESATIKADKRLRAALTKLRKLLAINNLP